MLKRELFAKGRSNRTKENDSAKVAANVNEEMSVGSWRGVLEGSGNLVACTADVAAVENFAGA